MGVILAIMEKKMETTIIYWGYMGYIGIMEKEMRTTNNRVCKGGFRVWGLAGAVSPAVAQHPILVLTDDFCSPSTQPGHAHHGY